MDLYFVARKKKPQSIDWGFLYVINAKTKTYAVTFGVP